MVARSDALLFPRDEKKSMREIKAACKNGRVAMTSSYLFFHDGEMVEGPSIRLAELLANKWGNIQHGTKGIQRSPAGVIVTAYAIDLEKNVEHSTEILVPIKTWSRSKVYEAIAASEARRRRNCILSVIPWTVRAEAEEQCNATLKGIVSKNDDLVEEKRSAILDAVDRKTLKVDAPRDTIKDLSGVCVWKLSHAIKDGMI